MALLMSALTPAQVADEHGGLTYALEDMQDDGASEANDELAESLAEIEENPINLNDPDYDALSAMPAVSPLMVRSIARKVLTGGFADVSELYGLPGFDSLAVARLMPYVYVGGYDHRITGRRRLRVHGKSLLRVQTSLPRAVGYRAATDTTEAAFKGGPYKVLLKQEFTANKRLRCGLLFENDAGEPMFSRYYPTTDFVSGFVNYKPRNSWLKQVILGNYSARFGQGLGLWTGFAVDFSSMQTSVTRCFNGIAPNFSAAESGYLRGLAARARWGSLTAVAFASSTKGDATLADDTLTLRMQSISATGYHRTASELSKRHSLRQQLYGAYARYSHEKVAAGCGVNHWHSGIPLAEPDKPYKKFYPTGSDLTTLSADYVFYDRPLSMSGEVAWQSGGGYAVLQNFDFLLPRDVCLTLSYRNYGRKYFSVYQNSFSRSSQPGGEEGLYAALSLSPVPRLSLLGSVNVYRYRWMRYQVPAPSTGSVMRLHATCTVSAASELRFRFKYDRNERQPIGGGSALVEHSRKSYKLVWQSVFDYVTIRSTLDLTSYDAGRFHSNGFMISQNVRYRLPRFTIDWVISHFDTDDYYSRIYSFLPDVLYSFSIPSFQNRGIAGLMNVSYKPLDSLTLGLRVHHVRYSDRSVISSGHTQVNSSHTTELKLQARYRF